MKFVKNGPDIPEELIDAHQRGEVVFFCGAGISMNNGYPSFLKLYYDLCEYFDFDEDEYLQESISNEYAPLEIKLNSLANNVQGGITQVKKRIESDFNNVKLEGTLETQKAILKLSCNKDNYLHLITTNFDSLFSDAAKKIKSELPQLSEYYPPFLPLSYGTKWNGIVYLHGNLDNSSKLSNYDSIILTSSDFGKAYLTEGWATNFMKYVFSKYKVCFIGYSLKDQIFSYLMDSISDDDSNESVKAWIITDTKEDTLKNEDWLYKTKKYWKSKKVEPIFYVVNNHDYSKLHNSLIKWAEVYQDDSKFRYETIQKINKLSYDNSNEFIDSLKAICWCLFNPADDLLDQLKRLNHQSSLKIFLYLQNLIKAIKLLKKSESNSEYDSKFYRVTSIPSNFLNQIPYYLRNRIINELCIENWFSKDNFNNSDKIKYFKAWTYFYVADEELFFLFQDRCISLNDNDKCELLSKIAKYIKTATISNTFNTYKSLPLEYLDEIWHLYFDDLIDIFAKDSSVYNYENNHKLLSDEDTNYILSKFFRPVLKVTKTANKYRAFIRLAKTTDEFKFPVTYRNLPCVNNLIFSFFRLVKSAEKINLFSSRLPSEELNSDNHLSQYISLNALSKILPLVTESWFDLNNRDPKVAKGYLEIWMSENDIYFKKISLYGASYCTEITSHKIVQWLLSDCIDPSNKLSKVKVFECYMLTEEVSKLLQSRGNEFSNEDLELLVASILSIKDKEKSTNYIKVSLIDSLKNAGVDFSKNKFAHQVTFLLKNFHDDFLSDFTYILQNPKSFPKDPDVEELTKKLLQNYDNSLALIGIFEDKKIVFSRTLKKVYKSNIENFDEFIANILFSNFQYLNRDISNRVFKEHISLIEFTLDNNFSINNYYFIKFIDKSIECGYFEDNYSLYNDLIHKYIDFCKIRSTKPNSNQLDLFMVDSKEIISTLLGYFVVKLAENCIYKFKEKLSQECKIKLLNIIEEIFKSTEKTLIKGNLICILTSESLKNIENFKSRFNHLLNVNEKRISEAEHEATWLVFLTSTTNEIDISCPFICDNFLKSYKYFLSSDKDFSKYSSTLAKIILNYCNLYKNEIKTIIKFISSQKKVIVLRNLREYLSKNVNDGSDISLTEDQENKPLNNLKIFFEFCWTKLKVEDQLGEISYYISEIIVETGDAFLEFYKLLNIWLVPLSQNNFNKIVCSLCKKKIVNSYPNDAIDFMYQIKSKCPYSNFFLSPLIQDLVKNLDKNKSEKNPKLEEFMKHL